MRAKVDSLKGAGLPRDIDHGRRSVGSYPVVNIQGAAGQSLSGLAPAAGGGLAEIAPVNPGA